MKNENSPYGNKSTVLIIAFSIAVVTFLVFLPTLQNGFLIWDDDILVTNNFHIRTLDLDTVRWAFTNVTLTIWYPITMLSFAVDHAIWGLDPKGFHLTNNILHALNTFMVFILAYLLLCFARNEDESYKPAIVAAGVTALFFGLHPLRVESVAWIAERKDVLYSFFYLMSILSYLKYASVTTRKTSYYFASLFLFSLSLMSKPMAVTLPLVLLILDHYPLRRFFAAETEERPVKVIVEKLPFIVLAILSSSVTMMTNIDKGSLIGLDTYSFMTRVFVAVRGYIFYLYKMIVPQDLAPHYPYPKSVSFLSFEYAGAVTIFILLTAASILLYRKRKAVAAAWLYYLITLLPVIGIVQLGSYAAANRYTYLPLLGPFILVGVLAGSAFSRPERKTLQAFVLIIILALSGLCVMRTVDHISHWKSTVSLWSYQIELHPDRFPTAYMNRGLAYSLSSRYEEAVKDYSMAINLNPGDVKAYNNRGAGYTAMKQYEEAIKDYDKAIELTPENSKAYNNRAVNYLRIGRYEDALKDFNKAIMIDPLNVNAYLNRAMVYTEMDRFDEAIYDYNTLISIEARNSTAYYNLGLIYSYLGEAEEAVTNYKRAAALGHKKARDHLKKQGAE